jgi:hypothetical protein
MTRSTVVASIYYSLRHQYIFCLKRAVIGVTVLIRARYMQESNKTNINEFNTITAFGQLSTREL